MTACICGYACLSQMARHKRKCKMLKEPTLEDIVKRLRAANANLEGKNTSLETKIAALEQTIASLHASKEILVQIVASKTQEIDELKKQLWSIETSDNPEVKRLRKLLRDNPPPRPKMLPQRRLRLAANQGWTCKICKTMLNEAFQVDHIEPWSKTFNDDDSNLQVLCCPCHLAKTSVENSTQ